MQEPVLGVQPQIAHGFERLYIVIWHCRFITDTQCFITKSVDHVDVGSGSMLADFGKAPATP
jgi:hypothetical protein